MRWRPSSERHVWCLVGTARVVWAAAKITQALDFVIDVAVAEIGAELEADEVAR